MCIFVFNNTAIGQRLLSGCLIGNNRKHVIMVIPLSSKGYSWNMNQLNTPEKKNREKERERERRKERKRKKRVQTEGVAHTQWDKGTRKGDKALKEKKNTNDTELISTTPFIQQTVLSLDMLTTIKKRERERLRERETITETR